MRLSLSYLVAAAILTYVRSAYLYILARGCYEYRSTYRAYACTDSNELDVLIEELNTRR